MRGVKSIASAVLVLGGGVLLVSCGSRAPSSGAGNDAPLKTVWGEPDLQGIWTLETDTPLQRPAKFKDQATLTEAERAELDKQRAALLGRDKRVERGTELDVAGAYNAGVQHGQAHRRAHVAHRRSAERTDAAADARSTGSAPPPIARSAWRSCRPPTRARTTWPAARGGKYDPAPSPRLNEIPDRYNTGRMNRHDGPEDGSLGDRCIVGALPGLPTPSAVPAHRADRRRRHRDLLRHRPGPGLPAQHRDERQPASAVDRSASGSGDSRGHWEGNTLVVDVTNFTPKLDFVGSRENLHLVERLTRTGPTRSNTS